MSEAPANRRFAAILAADVVGYSRMMREDEAGTLAALKQHRHSVFEPAIARHNGRLVKLMGDGALVEFHNVVDAVNCAIEVQAARTAVPSGAPIVLRIGVELGNVIIDGDDIYGDGVNLAARLEAMAVPGGICISRPVYDCIRDRIAVGVRGLGNKRLKNIPEPVEVFAIEGSGIAALPERQTIHHCHAPDGTRLAYAITGQGPPLVKAANWLSHLEYDWESPVWHHLLSRLANNRTLIRYDPRGTGLSDRDLSTLSLDAWVSDLEAVVEAAAVERFPLLGISQACAISVAYAVKHPERVSHLILYGGFALGAALRSPDEAEKRAAMTTLVRLEWGADNAAIRHMFAAEFMPGATREQADTFNELQRRTTSAEGAYRYLQTTATFDIRALLPKIRMPTLVMHCRGDIRVPIEAGRHMADGIPGARFVELDGINHILLEQDRATQKFFEEIDRFLAA